MKKLLISLVLCSALLGSVSAQQLTTRNGSASDATIAKLHKMDLIIQILPLALTNEQIEKILPLLEKERAKEKAQLEKEDAVLAELAPEIDDVFKKAIEKGDYPSKAFMEKVASKTAAMGTQRQIALTLFTEELTAALLPILDAGQKKVMVNSFDSRFIDPSKKPEEMKDETKTRFFIQRIFMDPETRQLLIDIEAHRKSESAEGKS